MLESFREETVNRLSQDERILGVLMAGSLASGQGDRFSDLDLIIVVRPEDQAQVLLDCQAIAGGLGELLVCFTGEHVGEPRLLICLFGVVGGDGVIHVDLKVVGANDLAVRVDEPVVLYDRTGVCEAELSRSTACWLERDAQWFEDRIWIWLHYTAARLARGERLEALATMNFIREQVLAPMASTAAGLPQRGLRRFEASVPNPERLELTIGAPQELWGALQRAIALYRDLRNSRPPVRPALKAEQAVDTYIKRLSAEAA